MLRSTNREVFAGPRHLVDANDEVAVRTGAEQGGACVVAGRATNGSGARFDFDFAAGDAGGAVAGAGGEAAVLNVTRQTWRA